MAHSNAVTVDDTGTRHQGKNAYVTQIGNDCFAWFQTTASKSRINFLQLLRAQHSDYQINAHALAYMRQQRIPQQPLQRLLAHPCQCFADREQWEAHLKGLGITGERHRRIATEVALLDSVLAHGFSPELTIISDDAGRASRAPSVGMGAMGNREKVR